MFLLIRMSSHFSRCAILLLLGCIVPQYLPAQKIQVRLGKSQIALNEYFTITLSIQDGNIHDSGNFPVIPGFTKAGTSTSTAMRSFNGKVSNEHSITQNYQPSKQGSFQLPPFSITADGKNIRSQGTTIKVGPTLDRSQAQNPFEFNPFEENEFDKNRDLPQAEADAFFSVQADKTEVWAGQGLTITISFFVSDENQAELNFYEVGSQLSGFTKKIKPSNCWEENFGIEEIQQHRVKINGKGFTEYRIFQSALFPQSPGIWEIPSLKLDMVQTSGGFFRQGKQEIKSFASRPLSIRVKDLPEHPMKGKVSVGDFRLEEKPLKAEAVIRQGIAYDFEILGEGNISYIQPPAEVKTSLIDIYPPNSRQLIQRAGGRVTGSKLFSYLLVPKELGDVSAGKSLSWIFFNTRTSRYDTLLPAAVFRVKNSSKAAKSGSAQNEDSFFSLLEKVDDSPVNMAGRKSGSLLWYNLAIALMALVSLLLVFRRK